MSIAHDIHLHEPQTLYRHWEDSQRNPFAIDLTSDRDQWPRMTGEDRGLVHWARRSEDARRRTAR